VPSYTFKYGCYWSEVPGGSLLVTGRGYPSVREVVRIDTRREFAVAHCPPMLTPRADHAAVHHTPHLYILGDLDLILKLGLESHTWELMQLRLHLQAVVYPVSS
jgi:hypothetical protein